MKQMRDFLKDRGICDRDFHRKKSQLLKISETLVTEVRASKRHTYRTESSSTTPEFFLGAAGEQNLAALSYDIKVPCICTVGATWVRFACTHQSEK